MTIKSIDDLDRIDALCEVLAEAFADANDEEIDLAMADLGLQADEIIAGTADTIENSLNKALKKKLLEAGQLARRETSARPDLTSLTRDELIERLRAITANDDNAGEMLTMAARAGRGSMSIDELRSLIEDFHTIVKSGADDD